MRPIDEDVAEIYKDDTLSAQGHLLSEQRLCRERCRYYESHPFKLLWWTLRWKLGL